MILLTPPVTKATEKVVGEEPVDGVPDYIDIDRLLYPEPSKDKKSLLVTVFPNAVDKHHCTLGHYCTW